jgi:hypothetical protein
MALFPSKDTEVLFVASELWVPVVRLRGKLCILPGIPRLFEVREGERRQQVNDMNIETVYLNKRTSPCLGIA